MKTNNEIVSGVLGTLLSPEVPIIQGRQTYQFRELVARLVIGLNDIIAIGDQREFLQEEQAMVDDRHIDQTEELDNEMIRLQDNCPHFSVTERPIKEDGMWNIIVCDICGKLIEQGKSGGNQ